jgi:hypothetical protein
MKGRICLTIADSEHRTSSSSACRRGGRPPEPSLRPSLPWSCSSVWWCPVPRARAYRLSAGPRGSERERCRMGWRDRVQCPGRRGIAHTRTVGHAARSPADAGAGRALTSGAVVGVQVASRGAGCPALLRPPCASTGAFRERSRDACGGRRRVWHHRILRTSASSSAFGLAPTREAVILPSRSTKKVCGTPPTP